MSFEADMLAKARQLQQKAIEVAKDQEADWPDYHYKDKGGPESYFASLASQVAEYAQMPDPDKFDPLIEDLSRVLRRMSSGMLSQDPIERQSFFANPNLDAVTNTKEILSRWHGPAANEFRLNFIDPFPTTVRNQFIIAATLRAALRASKQMWINARKDLDNALTQTINALDEKSGCCTNNGWTITFSIVEAIAVIAAVPTAGTSIAGMELAVAGVAAAAGIAANWPKEQEDPPQQNSSEAAWQVIDDLWRGLIRLTHEVRETEAKIANAIGTNNAFIGGHMRAFVSPRPRLASSDPTNIRANLGTAI